MTHFFMLLLLHIFYSLFQISIQYYFILNQFFVLKQIFTSISIIGTSIKTPTTVAKEAPEDNPKSIVEVAMATSKWLEAPIMAAGAAFSYEIFKNLAAT